jgi:hypothetical protein
MLVAIWAYNIAALVIAGDTLIAALFFLILLIPISIVLYTFVKRRENHSGNTNVYDKLKTFLIPVYGAAFACWLFDISTTYYAIDVVREATELNPLGWPLGAVGALVFYVPVTVFAYTLLFKIGQKYSIAAAAVITFLTACLGSMNFNEGVHNFGFFLNSVSFTMEGYSFLFSLVVAADLVYAVAFAKLARREANLIKRTIN